MSVIRTKNRIQFAEDFVLNNGKIGIATNDPQQTLDVVGNIGATGLVTASQLSAGLYQGEVRFLDNVFIDGNISIAGTQAIVDTTTLRIEDADIILGFTTNQNGDEVSSDDTANHGGIAIASTEGTPLSRVVVSGIETLPATYKKIMWFKSDTFSGVSTDAWMINYGVSIGNTTNVPTGTRLAAGDVLIGQDDITAVRNVNATGIITGSTADFNSYTDLNVTGVSTFTDTAIFDSTGSIQIPVGTTTERPGIAVTGQIRYNTENSSFEGYGPGGAWGSLGGIKDVDGDTYILAETSAGSDEDTLYFYSGGQLTGTISSTSQKLGGIGTDPYIEVEPDGIDFVGVSTFANNVNISEDLEFKRSFVETSLIQDRTWSTQVSGSFDRPVANAFDEVSLEYKATLTSVEMNTLWARTSGNAVLVTIPVNPPLTVNNSILVSSSYDHRYTFTIDGVVQTIDSPSDIVTFPSDADVTFYPTRPGSLSQITIQNLNPAGRTYLSGIKIDGVRLADTGITPRSDIVPKIKIRTDRTGSFFDSLEASSAVIDSTLRAQEFYGDGSNLTLIDSEFIKSIQDSPSFNEDFGKVWSKVELTGIGAISSIVYCGNGIVLVSNLNNINIYRSTDYGQTFISYPITTDTPPSGGAYDAVVSLEYAGNGVLFAGTGNTSSTGDGQVLKSTDYGLTWRAPQIGDPFIISPFVNQIKTITYCGDNIVLAGGGFIDDGTIYRSTDLGETWTFGFSTGTDSIEKILYCGNGVVLAGTSGVDNEGDIYRSTNNGSSWTKIEMGSTLNGIQSLVYCGNGIILAGSGSGTNEGDIYRSTDTGLTWTQIEMGSTIETIESLVYCGNGIVFAGGGTDGGDGNIYKSTDFGLTWSSAIEIATNLDRIEDLVYCGNGILLSSGGNGSGDGDIYRSDMGFGQASTIQGIYHEHLTGNIGVGSTSPASKLDVAGDVTAKSFIGDGENIRSVYAPEAALASYASHSETSNSALSIAGLSTYTEVGKFTGSQSGGNDDFGNALAVSADGKTIVVGANGDELTVGGSGLAYVFDREGNNFNQVGILSALPSNTDASDQFGYSVAISDDGRTIAVGAIWDEAPGNADASGIVYVYDRVGNDFNRVGILTGSLASDVNDNFGSQVALNGDGKTLIVGAPEDETNTTGEGVAYVFDKVGTTYNQVGILTATVGNQDASDKFGSSVQVSSDGKTFAIGAQYDEIAGSGASQHGLVYIFDRNGNSFEQVGILTGTYAQEFFDSFGSIETLALSANGRTIAVGAPADEISGSNEGLVYVFDRVGDTFSEVGILTGSYVENNEAFGKAVAINADGTVIAAATGANDGLPGGSISTGVVYVFNRQGEQFNEVAAFVGSDTATGDVFGSSLGVSADGKSIIVGAENASSSGQVYVFDEEKETYVYSDVEGNIGIGSAIPTEKLDVAGNIAVSGTIIASNLNNVSVAATFIASPGVAYTMDSYTLATDNLKTAEYTIHIENGTNIQSQKLLVMQNGTTAFSQEYAIMFDPDSLVSIASTLNAGVVSVEITPETGVLGLTTYRYIRQSIS